MNVARALVLMTVAAWSALSGGLAGALHLCQMAEVPTACVCPHAAPGHDADARNEGPQLLRADCCELHTSFTAAAPALTQDLAARLLASLAAPALPVAWHSADALLPTEAERAGPYEGPAPPHIGGPVFLKIRTLLI